MFKKRIFCTKAKIFFSAHLHHQFGPVVVTNALITATLSECLEKTWKFVPEVVNFQLG